MRVHIHIHIYTYEHVCACERPSFMRTQNLEQTQNPESPNQGPTSLVVLGLPTRQRRLETKVRLSRTVCDHYLWSKVKVLLLDICTVWYYFRNNAYLYNIMFIMITSRTIASNMTMTFRHCETCATVASVVAIPKQCRASVG